MTGEAIKALMMLFLFGALEAALVLPEMQLKHLRARSRRERARNRTGVRTGMN
jgi:hypothetical protein